LGNADEWLDASSEGLAPPVKSSAPRARFRLTYSKLERARFIGHLELVDVFIRALRRAQIPVAYTQGHHPLPRLRFGPGLPLGVESLCETIDIDLVEALTADALRRRLEGCLPEGLTIVGIAELSLQSPSADTQLSGFRYQAQIVDLINGDQGAWIDARFADFLATTSYPVVRTTPKGKKTVDARPLVSRLARVHDTVAELDLHFTLSGSVRPAELLAAILNLTGDTARSLPLRKTHAFYRTEDVGAAATRPA
jgi:radical SAM-linked protein